MAGNRRSPKDLNGLKVETGSLPPPKEGQEPCIAQNGEVNFGNVTPSAEQTIAAFTGQLKLKTCDFPKPGM
jgi:hypothetical protein